MASRERALKAIRLENTDRIPHKEGLTCPAFETALTGIDAIRYPFSARLKTLEMLDIDMDLTPGKDEVSEFIFEGDEVSTKDSEGRTLVRWGSGTTWEWEHGNLFPTIEEVLAFDPEDHFLKKGGSPYFGDIKDIQPLMTQSIENMGETLNAEHQRIQNLVGQSAEVPGFFYRTFFMWPLMLFGWENFAYLALQHEDAFTRIAEGFVRISEKVCQAFALTNIRVFMSHDDLCGKDGPFFNPSWYQKYVYPSYERIWAPLKEEGIKILYVSDGKLDSVVDDVMAAGADGILAEPATDLAAFAERYGKSAIFVGNVDGRILKFGTRKEIRREVDRVSAFGKDCPGYFYGVTNAITWDTPVENIRYYFDYCSEIGRR
jgi:hypothetical protein